MKINWTNIIVVLLIAIGVGTFISLLLSPPLSWIISALLGLGLGLNLDKLGLPPFDWRDE